VDAGYFAKLSVAGLLRGDAKSRAEFYTSGIVNGWMTRNEARKLEDLDPLEGLDEPLVPLNLGTKAQADAIAKKAAAAPADKAPADPEAQKALAKAIAAELGRPDLEEKVGRALSARNEGKLVEARDLLNEVLDQVAEEDDEE